MSGCVRQRATGIEAAVVVTDLEVLDHQELLVRSNERGACAPILAVERRHLRRVKRGVGTGAASNALRQYRRCVTGNRPIATKRDRIRGRSARSEHDQFSAVEAAFDIHRVARSDEAVVARSMRERGPGLRQSPRVVVVSSGRNIVGGLAPGLHGEWRRVALSRALCIRCDAAEPGATVFDACAREGVAEASGAGDVRPGGSIVASLPLKGGGENPNHGHLERGRLPRMLQALGLGMGRKTRWRTERTRCRHGERCVVAGDAARAV